MVLSIKKSQTLCDDPNSGYLFDIRILAVIQKDLNILCVHQVNKKKQEGPLKPKTVNTSDKSICARNKNI
jgi:hypothetical protein